MNIAKKVIMISIVTLLMVLLATTAYAQMIQHHYAIVSTSDPAKPVPLYAEADPSAAIRYSYYHGTLVKLLNQEQQDMWEVSIAGVQGFMEPSNLAVMDFAEMATELPVMKIRNKTDSGVLNLRVSPSLQSDIIRQYTNDEEVLLMGVSDEWCHVIGYGSRVGYMKPEYLEPANEMGYYMFGEDILQLRPRKK